jgi:hypothetical protein
MFRRNVSQSSDYINTSHFILTHFTLKMEATSSSEMLVTTYNTTINTTVNVNVGHTNNSPHCIHSCLMLHNWYGLYGGKVGLILISWNMWYAIWPGKYWHIQYWQREPLHWGDNWIHTCNIISRAENLSWSLYQWQRGKNCEVRYGRKKLLWRKSKYDGSARGNTFASSHL